jgi:hypothetical protein
VKKFLAGFACGAILFGALPLLAEDVFRIVPGTKSGLDDRVLQLERAVVQLQGKVYGATPTSLPTGAPVDTGVTCVLETPFDGAFSANAATETAARDETLKKCRDRGGKGNIYCVKSAVKCQR